MMHVKRRAYSQLHSNAQLQLLTVKWVSVTDDVAHISYANIICCEHVVCDDVTLMMIWYLTRLLLLRECDCERFQEAKCLKICTDSMQRALGVLPRMDSPSINARGRRSSRFPVPPRRIIFRRQGKSVTHHDLSCGALHRSFVISWPRLRPTPSTYHHGGVFTPSAAKRASAHDLRIRALQRLQYRYPA